MPSDFYVLVGLVRHFLQPASSYIIDHNPSFPINFISFSTALRCLRILSQATRLTRVHPYRKVESAAQQRALAFPAVAKERTAAEWRA